MAIKNLTDEEWEKLVNKEFAQALIMNPDLKEAADKALAPSLTTSTSLKNTVNMKDIKRDWLYNTYAREFLELMKTNPGKLARQLLNSDKIMEFIILGVTYPFIIQSGLSPIIETKTETPITRETKTPIIGELNRELKTASSINMSHYITNLVTSMLSLTSDPEYINLGAGDKLRFLNRSNALLELIKLLDSSVDIDV